VQHIGHFVGVVLIHLTTERADIEFSACFRGLRAEAFYGGNAIRGREAGNRRFLHDGAVTGLDPGGKKVWKQDFSALQGMAGDGGTWRKWGFAITMRAMSHEATPRLPRAVSIESRRRARTAALLGAALAFCGVVGVQYFAISTLAIAGTLALVRRLIYSWRQSSC
jgi:hypothetical protein